MFHYNRYGIDEGAAHALLLNWAIGSQMLSPVAVLGFPDLRALLFAPLNFHWIGDLSAAKVLTMYLTFATALMLYRWAERKLDDETALFATGLWLIAPLTIFQVDSIGAGNYLIFCAIAGFWLNEHLRASTRSISGYYFLLIMVLALAASMHPAGVGMVLAVAWTWLRDKTIETRRRYTMIGGMVVLIFFVVFSRMGWPELTMLHNPLAALVGVLVGDLRPSVEASLGLGVIAAVMLLLSATASLRRENRDLLSTMLLAGIGVGLLSPDRAWSELALVLILYEGVRALIVLNSRLDSTSLAAKRALVAVAVFAFSLLFMMSDKERILLKHHHQLQPTDEVIAEMAQLTGASNKAMLVASQWPARTMLATRSGALPLPPVHKDDPQAFLRQMRGVTYMAFDQNDDRNRLLRREVAELSDRVKTVAIFNGGVIVVFPPADSIKKK
jgi:hypothetical protein